MEILDMFKDITDYESYSPGETIFEQGDNADRMYVVKEGEVDIMLKGKVVETAKPGHLFGEMSLVDQRERSATVRAKTACELVPVDRLKFKELIQKEPDFAIHVMEVMANRIRNMDEWWSVRWG